MNGFHFVCRNGCVVACVECAYSSGRADQLLSGTVARVCVPKVFWSAQAVVNKTLSFSLSTHSFTEQDLYVRLFDSGCLRTTNVVNPSPPPPPPPQSPSFDCALCVCPEFIVTMKYT